MAKALMGHVGYAPDARMITEVHRLRDRVRALEAENQRLSEANAALNERLHDLALHQEMMSLAGDHDLSVEIAAEPALSNA